MNPIKTIHKKIVLFIMLLMFFVSMIFQTIQNVYAHSVYYLAVTVDMSSFVYTGTIIQDDEGFWSREASHAEYEVGEFDDINIKDRNVDALKGGALDLSKVTNKGVKEYLAFSLPSKEVGENHITDKQVELIYKAQENVVQGLNDAIVFINKGKNPESKEELYDISVKLLTYTTVSSSGGTISHDGEKYNVSFTLPTGFKLKQDFKKEDYVTITRESDKETLTVPFQLSKQEDYTGDLAEVKARYFHWGGFVLHAWQAASDDKKIYTQNVGTISKPSKLTEMFVDFVGDFTNGLRSMLGLYSLNDLVFNEGTRGGSSFIHGIAPKSWIDSALTYHLIFQGFAVSLLMFSIVKTLLQRNLATVNTNIRVSLIEGFQNIIVAAIALTLIIPLMNSLMYLNFLIAEFFGTTVPDYAALADTSAYTNLIGGVVMQLVYFGISLYYNFIYIIRSITITILIAIVPLFIVVYAFGGQWKGYFWAWFKEFVANVFMQSFHAMMLSLFFTLSLSSRGIESIVVLMAIIPLSNFFRKIIFGGAGDATTELGMGSLSIMSALGTTAVSHAGKLLPSRAGAANAAGNAATNAAGNVASNAGTNNSRANSNASKLKTSTAGINTTINNDRKVAPVTDGFNVSNASSNPATSVASLQNRMNQVNENKGKFDKGLAHIKNTGSVGMKGARVAGDAARVGLGAASLATGYGTSLAMGAGDFRVMMGAQKMNDTGIKSANDGATSIYGAGKEAYGAVRKDNNIEVEQYDNGDMKVEEGFNTFKGTGKGQAVKDAFMDNDKNLVMFYEKSALSQKQQKFFNNVEQAYSSGDQHAIDTYKKMGIQSIGKSQNGQLAVTYNQEGKRKMGIREMNFDHNRKRVSAIYAPGGQIGDDVSAATLPEANKDSQYPVNPYAQNQNQQQPKGKI